VSAGRPTQRLFFALWPSPAARTALARAARRAVRASGGKPVPPDNYHVTLLFLGPVPADIVPALSAAAARIAPPACELRLERFGGFARSRVLWAAPAATPPPLAEYVLRLREASAAAGLEPDPRPLHAHVTLARKLARAAGAGALEPVSWPVDASVLVSSATGGSASTYRILERFPAGSRPEPKVR